MEAARDRDGQPDTEGGGGHGVGGGGCHPIEDIRMKKGRQVLFATQNVVTQWVTN